MLTGQVFYEVTEGVKENNSDTESGVRSPTVQSPGSVLNSQGLLSPTGDKDGGGFVRHLFCQEDYRTLVNG